ncbi:hypothetical protein M8494_25565 [Serratia ureilytica]
MKPLTGTTAATIMLQPFGLRRHAGRRQALNDLGGSSKNHHRRAHTAPR